MKHSLSQTKSRIIVSELAVARAITDTPESARLALAFDAHLFIAVIERELSFWQKRRYCTITGAKQSELHSSLCRRIFCRR
jgi:hypothetical protein